LVEDVRKGYDKNCLHVI
jgi:hypothetical protein